MDLAVVSLGWFREFHRLRRCLPPAQQRPPAETPTRFAIQMGEVPGLSPESSVQVRGGEEGEGGGGSPLLTSGNFATHPRIKLASAPRPPFPLATPSQLTGSFSGWHRKHPMALAPDGAAFVATVALPPGTWKFKFVVDGVWTAAPSLPTADDNGIINNVINILNVGEEDEE